MKRWCFIIFSLFFCFSFVAAQTTVVISAAADNTLYENPSANSNALGQNIFSGTNGSGSPRRGLIRFNVATVIPANAIITSVTLTLNCNLSRSVADNISLHKVVASWGEGTSNAGSVSDGQGAAATVNDATWATRFFPGTLWTTAGGDYSAIASASVSINSTGFFQWSTASMVADVQSWLAAPASNFGWILICNETVISTARKFGSKENATVANRPSLSVTYTVSLPVTLTYFKAVQKNKSVLLSWETSQEINNHYFEILHSSDGVTFSPIGKMNGNGTSAMKHQYHFIQDINNAGNYFYKLAQVDFDGKQKYSPVEKVYVSAMAGSMKVVPNPVVNEFVVSSKNNLQNATYTICNLHGSVVATGVLGAGAVKAYGLKAGTYFLCLYENKKQVNQIVFIKM